MQKIETAHEANIFSALFAPHSDNTRVISGCGGGALRDTSIEKPSISTLLLQVAGMVVKTDTCLNNQCLLAATTFKGAVIIDPRTPGVVCNDRQLGSRMVIAVQHDPWHDWLVAVGGDSNAVSIYDLRYLRENGELRILRGENTTPRMHVSNLQYSPARPGVLLINYLGIHAPVLQVDVITGKTIQAHLGRVNVKTFAKDAVYINDGTAVATGSDDGSVVCWNRYEIEPCRRFKGDSRVVNCIASHPNSANIAVSGIDSDIKWLDYSGIGPGMKHGPKAENGWISESDDVEEESNSDNGDDGNSSTSSSWVTMDEDDDNLELTHSEDEVDLGDCLGEVADGESGQDDDDDDSQHAHGASPAVSQPVISHASFDDAQFFRDVIHTVTRRELPPGLRSIIQGDLGLIGVVALADDEPITVSIHIPRMEDSSDALPNTTTPNADQASTNQTHN